MPVTTGFLFVPLLLLCVYLLGQIPPPDDRDIAQRARREPMLKEHRIAFFRRHWVGVLGLIIVFLLLTIGRSLRDDFAVEIWRDLGIESEPSVYASTETVVMFGVLLLTGIGVGLAFGLATVLRDSVRLPALRIKEDPDSDATRYELIEQVNFLHKAGVGKIFMELENGSNVIIDGTKCISIDPDVLETIHEFIASSSVRDITVKLEGLPEPAEGGVGGH